MWHRPAIADAVQDGSGRYWLGSRKGIWRLDADGPAWRLVPQGLDGHVSALTIDSEGFLIAAVDGRGVFRARLPG